VELFPHFRKPLFFGRPHFRDQKPDIFAFRDLVVKNPRFCDAWSKTLHIRNLTGFITI
jgi:hypothetical protein